MVIDWKFTQVIPDRPGHGRHLVHVERHQGAASPRANSLAGPLSPPPVRVRVPPGQTWRQRAGVMEVLVSTE